MNVFDFVMKMEDDGYKYYKNLVNTATLPGLKTIFTSMAEDEQKHYNILENVYNFVNAPNMHLEWGEFSNLGEFRQFGRNEDV